MYPPCINLKRSLFVASAAAAALFCFSEPSPADPDRAHQAPPSAPSITARPQPATTVLLPRLDGGAQQLYSIGNPTAEEQLYLEYINRARANPAAEGARLAATTDPEVRGAYQAAGVDLVLMQAQLAAIPPQPPLSMNATLSGVARAHSQDMLANNFQGHTGSNGSTTASRIIGSGYTANAGYFFGENVYAAAKSVFFGHAAFEVDWGGTAATGGMQSPPGHRNNIHSADFREVGIGVALGSNQNVGPQLVTQDFGSRSDAIPFVTGVIYRDRNANGFYDIGEGVGGVTVTIPGADYYAVSASSGGYSVPVPENGGYTVNFSGGGAPAAQRSIVVSGGHNVKLDYTPAAAPGRGDFNSDGNGDLIWQNNATGQRAIWLMNGSTYAGERFLPTITTQWQIAGTGDFNSDGHADIVWQNDSTGQRAIWLMSGSTWVGERFLPTVPPVWQIAGTGHFNADDQVDLIWQNTATGQRAIWLMNGSTWVGERFLPTVGLEWQIAATGDFNGDGQTDIVWQNTATGQRAIWLMNGSNWVGERFLPTIPTQWQIAAAGDFSGDGQTDLVWQNTITGQRAIWLMNGSTWVGERFLPTVPTQWEIRNR